MSIPLENHEKALIEVGHAMIKAIHDIATAQRVPLTLRVGISTGPIIGTFIFIINCLVIYYYILLFKYLFPLSYFILFF